MIPVTIISVGALSERHWKDASAEYIKRLGAFCKLSIIEISESRLPKNPSAAEILKSLEDEGNSILSKIPPRAYVTALCVEGAAISSERLAGKLGELAVQSLSAVFIIGGSNGLSQPVKDRADEKISMSAMTFPHQLARVMLLEQLYRGFTINSGIKYHK